MRIGLAAEFADAGNDALEHWMKEGVIKDDKTNINMGRLEAREI